MGGHCYVSKFDVQQGHGTEYRGKYHASDIDLTFNVLDGFWQWSEWTRYVSMYDIHFTTSAYLGMSLQFYLIYDSIVMKVNMSNQEPIQLFTSVECNKAVSVV